MKKLLVGTRAALALNVAVRPAAAQGMAFIYQGHLENNGGPASGLYDFTFTPYITNVNEVVREKDAKLQEQGEEIKDLQEKSAQVDALASEVRALAAALRALDPKNEGPGGRQPASVARQNDALPFQGGRATINQ